MMEALSLSPERVFAGPARHQRRSALLQLAMLGLAWVVGLLFPRLLL
jgi:hypothetical protein